MDREENKVMGIIFKDKEKLKDAVGGRENFKVSWKKFKELYHHCDLKGKEDDNCKRLQKELNIEWINE